jgi:hypothetical protein
MQNTSYPTPYTLFPSRCTLYAERWALSTSVERTLQIRPFLCKTNPIFSVFRRKMKIMPKNKPNSNPIVSRANNERYFVVEKSNDDTL